MAKITRAMGALSLVTIVACAWRSAALAPESMDQLHAAVVADANAATDEALDDLSRALPPMDAPAERETDVPSTSVGTTAAALEEAPAKAPSASETGSKAKAPPPAETRSPSSSQRP